MTSSSGGRSCRATADLFGVGVSRAVEWSRQLRATGSAAARSLGRKQPRSPSAEREWLPERRATEPDVPLRALVAEWGERSVATRYRPVWRIVREAGITFRKGHRSPASGIGR